MRQLEWALPADHASIAKLLLNNVGRLVLAKSDRIDNLSEFINRWKFHPTLGDPIPLELGSKFLRSSRTAKLHRAT